MRGGNSRPRLLIAATGAANLASVRAMCARAGVEAIVTENPDELYRAERALLPGVGAFGAAMGKLREKALDEALAARIGEKRFTLGICLGMQMMCASSEESPDCPGLGILSCAVEKFKVDLPLPQLGWNRVEAGGGRSMVSPGWAYFANSYRIASPPEGYAGAHSSYGERFAATVEGYAGPEESIPYLLLCQFHPELSGPWGLDLFERWMGLPGKEDLKPKSPAGPSPARGTATRIIPCLDIKGGRVVKGVKFENLVDSGEPAELARRYEEEGADEIALLDISATLEERRTALEAVAAVRASVSIPVSVGGGIRSVDDAERLLNAGADRVSVNSAAVRDPGLIARLAEKFGVQCVIVAIDARRGKGEEGWEVFIDAGKTQAGLDAVEWARSCASLGAGEILLTSIDRDGTGLGYDCPLVSAVAAAARIPVIASGGATWRGHFLEGVGAGASALLGAGVFHRGELAIADLKSYLSDNGVEVRR